MQVMKRGETYIVVSFVINKTLVIALIPELLSYDTVLCWLSTDVICAGWPPIFGVGVYLEDSTFRGMGLMCVEVFHV